MGGTHGATDRELWGEDLAWAVVLIVDDQQPNVMLLERLLARMGVGRTVGVTDPREALGLYRSLDPDLVLVDWHMPHLDGLGILTALEPSAAQDAFTPVVVLTADTTGAAREAALAAGATDFLTKPFDQTEVVLRVRNLLRTKALHRGLSARNATLRSELAERERRERQAAAQQAERVSRVRRVLDGASIEMVFQPIVELESSRVVGLEALARFTGPPRRPPNEWFAEAASVGLGTELELAAVSAALTEAETLPDSAYLALNVSPATLADPRLETAIASTGAPVVLELTEHTEVDGYDALVESLGRLRRAGARIAVDDAGAGYSSLRHILRLGPDIIKLDIGLTRGIDADPARRALAAALVTFAEDTGASLVAEGIEGQAELEALRHLRIRYGQGFYLGRPGPLIQVPDQPSVLSGR